MHALIIYDDLSKQPSPTPDVAFVAPAAGTRGLSGRCVYLHSRVGLERAAKLNDAHGAGSLTALAGVKRKPMTFRPIFDDVISITGRPDLS